MRRSLLSTSIFKPFLQQKPLGLKKKIKNKIKTNSYYKLSGKIFPKLRTNPILNFGIKQNYNHLNDFKVL